MCVRWRGKERERLVEGREDMGKEEKEMKSWYYRSTIIFFSENALKFRPKKVF